MSASAKNLSVTKYGKQFFIIHKMIFITLAINSVFTDGQKRWHSERLFPKSTNVKLNARWSLCFNSLCGL